MLEEKIECKLQAGNTFLSELSAMLPTCQLLPLWKAETMGIQEMLSLILKCEFIRAERFSESKLYLSYCIDGETEAQRICPI